MLVTRLRQTFAVGLLACGLIGVGGALAQQLGAPVTQDPVIGVAGAPLQPETDPFVGQPQPKKVAEPKKIGAKGVEDDDVPYGSFPAQAVVRIEEGKLIVRQRTQAMEAVVQKVGEQTVVSYQTKSGVRATTHDPADIAVFDMKGNRLSPKAWKELLKSDVHSLVAHDGKLPNPRELTLFKQDTLLIVLPGSANVPAQAGYTTTTAPGGATYYVPSAPVPPAVVRPSGTALPAAPPSRPATPVLPPMLTLPPPVNPPGLSETGSSFVPPAPEDLPPVPSQNPM